jgi:hypothetical protein
MESPTLSGPEGLAVFAETCARSLLAKVQYEFVYPEGCSLENWPVERIKAANEPFLKSLRNRGNVYAIFVRPVGKKTAWSHMYVGERKSAGLRQRMTEHLIDKDHRTGSMLEAVKTAISANQAIGLSFIKVEPESLRLFVEETIIAKHKQELPWNTQG